VDNKNIHRVLDVLQNLSRGEYYHKIENKDNDPQLAAFAKSLNHLSDTLERNISTLRYKHKQLLEREKELNAVLEKVQTGILIIACNDRRIITCNKKAEEIIGLPKKKLAGELCHNFICPNEKGHCPVLDKDEDIDNSERIVLNRNGKEVPILKNVIKINYNNQPALLESFIDISEIKEVDRKLRDSEKNFKDTIRYMSKGIAIYRWDAVRDDFIFTEFNKYAEKIENLSRKEVLGSGLKEKFPGVVEFGLFDVMKKVLKTGNPEFFPVSAYQDNRISGYRENYVYRLTNMNIVCLYDDLTEQKMMEEEIRKSRERFDLAIQGSSDGIWDWDLQTNELFLSPRWKAQLGYEDHEIKSSFETFKKRIHPDDIDKVFTRLNKYLEGKAPNYEVEFRMQHKNGEYLWILARAMVIRDKNGKPVRMAGSHTDVTDRKKIQEELTANNKTKDRFFSIIAHDLKSPLGSLMNISEILVNNEIKLPEEQKEKMLEAMYSASKKTYGLLQNLLMWSRSQSGRVSFEPQLFHIKELIDSIMELMETTAMNKSLTVKNNIAPETRVFADQNMLETVFRNLLSNAIKFTPKGGKIIFSANDISGGKTEICISDTGEGIKKENIPRLFKVDESYTTKGTENEEGTGLGLVLCKEFIDRHCGTIDVESRIGKGTTFRISLPLQEE